MRPYELTWEALGEDHRKSARSLGFSLGGLSARFYWGVFGRIVRDLRIRVLAPESVRARARSLQKGILKYERAGCVYTARFAAKRVAPPRAHRVDGWHSSFKPHVPPRPQPNQTKSTTDFARALHDPPTRDTRW